MQEARSDRAWTRPWVALALAATLLTASVGVALATVGDLGIGSLRLVDRPAEPSAADAELYLVLSGDGDPAPEDRAFRISEEVVSAQLAADPAVTSVRRVTKGDAVILIAGFGDASSADREDAATRLANTVDPGALRVRAGGEVLRQVDDREELEEELWRKELLVVPLALLALIFAVGLRMLAGPVLCAAIAIAGSLAGLGLIGGFADVSVLGAAPAAAVGLVLGLELPLRALRSRDAPEREPRLCLAVGMTAALPGFALLATGLDQAGSLALGTALAAILAAVATLLVVPAVATLAPRREALPPRAQWPRFLQLASGAALIGLCALSVPAVVYGTTAPYAALGERSLEDSLFSELPLAAAIAAAIVSAALTWLARNWVGIVLGLLTLLPAAAALGVAALLSEHGEFVGRNDPDGTFFDTGAAATAACAVVAVSSARSAMTANAFRLGHGLELTPAVTSTAVAVLACGALFAVELDEATDLSVALAAGLLADLLLLRVPLRVLGDGRIGSRGG